MDERAGLAQWHGCVDDFRQMAGKDTKTRYQGVFARHQKACALGAGGARCNCKPSYYGVVWDRERKRQFKTKRLPTRDAARNAPSDLSAKVESGELLDSGGIRLADARVKFIASAREGRALNKRGRRYKPRAIDDIDEVLRVHVERTLGTKRISTVRRGHVQALIDELGPELSGSRVRSIINALRSLYRWAQDRELASHDPAALVRLPAMDATPIERVASHRVRAASCRTRAPRCRPLCAGWIRDGPPASTPRPLDPRRPSIRARRPLRSTSGQRRRTICARASSGRHASTRHRGGWCRSSRPCSRCSSAST